MGCVKDFSGAFHDLKFEHEKIAHSVTTDLNSSRKSAAPASEPQSILAIGSLTDKGYLWHNSAA